MGILDIKPAQRSGARLMFALAGVSGSGKTYSALQFAWGLAGGDASKVGMLDCENGRGRLYADILVGKDGDVHPFLHADLYAPFTPQRHQQAIEEFQRAGVEVLVIDSITHEWEGLGGCQDMATAAGKNGRQNWLQVKPRHRQMMNIALTCDMHIVFCVRAREMVEVVDEGGKKVFKNLGFLPVQERNFMFEMTTSLMMWDEGTTQQVLKCPEALREWLGRGDSYITAKDGLAVRRWVEGAGTDREVERARNTLQSQAEQGEQHIAGAWKALPASTRKALGTAFRDQVLASAKAFDDERSQAERDAETLDELNDQFAGDDDGDVGSPSEPAHEQPAPTSGSGYISGDDDDDDD